MEQEPRRPGRPGRPRQPKQILPKRLQEATVHKERENGRVVKGTTRVVLGTWVAVLAALAVSRVSQVVNTVFVERHHGSDRHRNRRQVGKTGCFSKDWQVPEAMTYCTRYRDHFGWPVRTLRKKVGRKKDPPRTPARVAGLTDHVWTIQEWASFPAKKLIRDG